MCKHAVAKQWSLPSAAPFPPASCKITWLTGQKGVHAAGDGAGKEQERFKRRRWLEFSLLLAMIGSPQKDGALMGLVCQLAPPTS